MRVARVKLSNTLDNVFCEVKIGLNSTAMMVRVRLSMLRHVHNYCVTPIIHDISIIMNALINGTKDIRRYVEAKHVYYVK